VRQVAIRCAILLVDCCFFLNDFYLAVVVVPLLMPLSLLWLWPLFLLYGSIADALQLPLAFILPITIALVDCNFIYSVCWCGSCALLMLLPLAVGVATLLCRITADTTAVATCCCNCHLLCSWLIVDSFFTLMWHSSHVSLSYAAATALLSASLLIAVPHCC